VGETSTDAEAVTASLDDDPSRFALLFDRHYAPLRRYLVPRIGDDVANDLAAQAFVTAFEIRTRYDLSRPDARAWLFGIATNLLRHHIRALSEAGAQSRRGKPRRTSTPREKSTWSGSPRTLTPAA
jgi:RNA polymerase sigma-70 factor (ECF subfamily)